jgi:hypothetical protein
LVPYCELSAKYGVRINRMINKRLTRPFIEVFSVYIEIKEPERQKTGGIGLRSDTPGFHCSFSDLFVF